MSHAGDTYYVMKDLSGHSLGNLSLNAVLCLGSIAVLCLGSIAVSPVSLPPGRTLESVHLFLSLTLCWYACLVGAEDKNVCAGNESSRVTVEFESDTGPWPWEVGSGRSKPREL